MLYCPWDIYVISLFIPYGELIFGDFYFLLIYIPYGK